MSRWTVVGVAVVLVALVAVELHAGAAAQKITVVAREFGFTPSKITVKVGQQVQLVLDNKGVVEHDFVVDRFKVETGLIRPGKTGTVTFTPGAKGAFPFYCSVPGHKEAGMTGTLIVQ